MPEEQLPLFSAPPEKVAAPRPGAVPAPVPAPPTPAPVALRASSPLRAAIVAWKAHLETEGNSLNTVKAFGGDLNLFADYLGAGRAVGEIATRDLNNWLQAGRSAGGGDRPWSPKTYARRVTSLKAFFRWLHQAGVMPSDPAAPVIQQSVISPLPEVLSEAEVQRALAAADALRRGPKADLRPYVLFTLVLQTGIKKGECLTLVPNHVDLSDPAEPVLWVRYPNPQHRYKERKLRLDASWVPAFREYLAQYSPQIDREKDHHLFPWSPRRLEYLLADISQAAGLEKQISFDMCRWTCAVREARAGMDADKIRLKLGLSKIQWREIGMKLTKLVEPAL